MGKVDVCELLEGMVLAEPIFSPQSGKKLLNEGIILNESIISSLRSWGIISLEIADRYTLLVDPSETTAKEIKKLLVDEIVMLAPDQAEANTSDKMVEVSKKSREIAVKILNDSNVRRFCVEMKLVDVNFLYKHSIETCALSLLVAGALGLSEAETTAIGTGALLHDMGLREMPAVIRSPKRNPQEELAWKEHPKYGYYFAKEAGLPDTIINMILYHHENWNGSGYPQGLSGENIPLGARIISVCETYSRLMLHENYTKHHAIEYLYGAGNYYFDLNVVKCFTNNLSVYPLGSLVRLTSGEVGVVANVRKNLGPRPVVRVYYNRVNRPLAVPKVVDLGKERTVFIEHVF